MIKGSIHQEGITILTIYAQNKTASKCLMEKPIEPQGEIDKPTIMVWDFNTSWGKTSTKKISKDREDFKNTTVFP